MTAIATFTKTGREEDLPHTKYGLIFARCSFSYTLCPPPYSDNNLCGKGEPEAGHIYRVRILRDLHKTFNNENSFNSLCF